MRTTFVLIARASTTRGARRHQQQQQMSVEMFAKSKSCLPDRSFASTDIQLLQIVQGEVF